MIEQSAPNHTAGDRSDPAARTRPRRHRWWRWLLAGVAAVVLLTVGAVAAFIKLTPGPAPLALPTARASAPAGPASGSWVVTAGSAAGFRVAETALGLSNDVVGRTSAVTGTLAILGDRVTSATFRVDLAGLRVNGKPQPQLARSLRTAQYPVATVTLVRPVTLGPAFADGAVVTAHAAASLTVNGVTRPVTITVSGRRSDTALQIAGSIPVVMSRWGITEPAGFGPLGSLSNHGIAEFLLILRQRT